jgi:hypothetical protein
MYEKNVAYLWFHVAILCLTQSVWTHWFSRGDFAFWEVSGFLPRKLVGIFLGFRYGKPRTVRYEPRAIGLQYNTYDPRFVVYFLGEYVTVRYDTNRENAGCKPSDFIYDPRYFLLCPEVFHDTIHGSYCISSGRNRIVLQILASQTDHAPIKTQYNLILTYGTGCI